MLKIKSTSCIGGNDTDWSTQVNRILEVIQNVEHGEIKKITVETYNDMRNARNRVATIIYDAEEVKE